jgi:hypothetical protein
MSAIRLLACIALLVASASWAYHRFFAYPYVAEVHDLGTAQVSVLVGPSDWSSPLSALADVGLVLGSIHNNTQITLELTSPTAETVKRVLLTGSDVAADHLPLSVRLVGSEVQVSDASRRFSAAIPYPSSQSQHKQHLD